MDARHTYSTNLTSRRPLRRPIASMGLLGYLRFIVWFAFNDLLARISLWTTLNCWFTVFAVLLIALLSLGILQGYSAVRQYRIQRNPLARCMWIGNPYLENQRLSEEQIEQLRVKIPAALPSPQRFRKCCPFYILDHAWIAELAAGESERRVPTFRGRTVAPDDPLLEDIKFASGRPLTRTDDAGIVVAPQMLKELGYNAAQPPDKISLRAIDGGKEELNVVGILGEDLPFGHWFVITQKAHDRITEAHRNIQTAQIYTGPVPDDWPLPEDLKQDVKEAIANLRIFEPELDTQKGFPRWKLEAKLTPHPVSNWYYFVAQIEKIMRDKTFSTRDDFLRIEIPMIPEDQEPVERSTYDMAAIYVQDLSDFSPVSELCKSLSIRFDQTIVDQLNRLGRESQNAFRVLMAGLVLIGLMAALNLTVIQNLLAQQKIAEIGMLKAIGMGKGLLWTIYLCETILIQVAAAIPAFAIVGPLGRRLAPLLLEVHDTKERALAFDCAWVVIAQLLLVSSIICCVATFLATRHARRLPPIAALSGHH